MSCRRDPGYTTGVLLLQNDVTFFQSHTLARRNYWAEMPEILHGTPLGDSAWVSRRVFGYSTRGPCYGVPLGSPGGGVKILKIFFFIFQFFLAEMSLWTAK